MTKKKRNLMEAYEEHKSTGNNEFFTLKDDKDTAIVRFLYEDPEQLDWYVVHEVTIGGKKRWLECTEEETCPACRRGNKVQLKLFLQLVQKGQEDKVKTWERGQNFVPIIMEQFTKFGSLASIPFEVQRNGKAGDSNTTYQLFDLESDGKTLADFTEKQVMLGENGFVLQKSLADMELIMQGNYEYQKVETPPRQTTPPASNQGAGSGISAGSETEVF